MARAAATARVFKDRFGTPVEVPSFAATKAKNTFGALMDAAAAHGTVAVTKRSRVEAVLLSIEEYEGLVAKIPDPLSTLRAEFDGLVAKMQGSKSRAAVDALFEAPSAELGRRAAKSARSARRG